jgi:hypothetical protein
LRNRYYRSNMANLDSGVGYLFQIVFSTWLKATSAPSKAVAVIGRGVQLERRSLLFTYCGPTLNSEIGTNHRFHRFNELNTAKSV